MKGWTKASLIVALLFLALVGLIVAATTITCLSQVPTDINSTNLISVGNDLNLTYNITNSTPLTNVDLYYKTNTSTDGYDKIVNGTEITGFEHGGARVSQISANIWQFLLDYNDVYPGTYNFPFEDMESATKLNYTGLNADGTYLKIQFLNVTNSDEYNFFMLDVQNQTAVSNSMRIYYCNSSYSIGDPSTVGSCTSFYDLQATEIPYHDGNNISYYVIPFAINTSTGNIGAVHVSPTSYLLLRGRKAPTWNVSYISNISRTDAVQYSLSKGGSWTNFAGTIDTQFHQFSGSNRFWYYVSANASGSITNSTIQSDLLSLYGLPPDGPNVFAPTTGYYSGNITINYTAAESPNGYAISYYNITLAHAVNDTYVTTIKSNNSVNLSYVWDSSGYDYGDYNIHVEACDNQSQCSLGESEDFTIENIAPNLTIISPTTKTYTTSSVPFSISANEELASCVYSLDDWVTNHSISKVSSTYFSKTANVPNGAYTARFSCVDAVGNLNSTVSVNFTVSAPQSYSGSASGTGSTSALKAVETNNFTQELNPTQTLSFTSNNVAHHLSISNINLTNKTVQFTIYSVPITFTLKENESKNVDLDNDSKYDITVKLLGITSNNLANVEVTKYVPPSTTSGTTTPSEGGITSTIKNNSYIWVVAIILVLALIAVFIIKRVKSRTLPRSPSGGKFRSYKNRIRKNIKI